MLLIAILTFSAAVAAVIVLNAERFVVTDCRYNYTLDDSGILRRDDNVSFIGEQCMTETVLATSTAVHNVCDPLGVDVVVVKSLWGQTYFHFILNELQRWFRAERLSHDWQWNASFVFTSWWAYDNHRQSEWFALAGITIAHYALPPRIRNVLIAPGSFSCSEIHDTHLVRIYRERALQFYQLSDAVVSSTTRVVLFHRVGRRAIGDDETSRIVALLHEFWPAIFGEAMLDVVLHRAHQSLSETFAMLNYKPRLLMIGPHGAGFANMLLAPSRSMVLEIHPSLYSTTRSHLFQPCFMDLASACGHYYAMAIARNGYGFSEENMTLSDAAFQAALHTLRVQMKLPSPV